jgi:long-chain acyl-CoA synthetase
VNRGSALQRSVFHAALAYKSFWLHRGFSSGWASPLVDRLVFGRTRGALGGRTRLILSGAAPLPQYIMEFLNAAFCCPVMQVGVWMCWMQGRWAG